MEEIIHFNKDHKEQELPPGTPLNLLADFNANELIYSVPWLTTARDVLTQYLDALAVRRYRQIYLFNDKDKWV